MNRHSAVFSLAVLLGLALVATACGSGEPLGTATLDADPAPSAPVAPEISAAPEADPEVATTMSPVTLYVSNQSFDDLSVTMTVTIDGTVVADQEFNVEGQHNWITFDLELPPGDHDLVAVSDGGTELIVDFTTVPDQPRWAVIDYWWYSEEGDANFTFDISDEPIGFA